MAVSNDEKDLPNESNHVSVLVQGEIEIIATTDDNPVGGVELLCRTLLAGNIADAEELFRHNKRVFSGHKGWIQWVACLVWNAQAGMPNMFFPWIVDDILYSCACYPADADWWHGLTERHVPPLFLLVHARRMDIANFILQHSEARDVLNQRGHTSGWTALEWAVKLRLPEVEDLLMELHVSLENSHGNSPPDYTERRAVVMMNRPDIIDENTKLRRLTDSLAAMQILAGTIAQITFSSVPAGNGMIWILNFMAFVYAMACSLAAVTNRLPTPRVEQARILGLQVPGILLAVSVACVMFQFGMSQFEKKQGHAARTIMVPIDLAVSVCTIMLAWFLARLLSIRSMQMASP